MTAPHPALLALAANREAPPVGDEDVFLRSVSEHRMTATVLTAHQQGAIRLSDELARTFGMWDLAERRDHLRFWRAAGEVQARLAPLGAEVAVLKGIATEARWYDELGQRACTDLDLLLAPDALADVLGIVEAIDPRRPCPVGIDGLVRRRVLQHMDLHLGTVQVDLHFDPLKVGLPTRQLDEVWCTTQVLDTAQGSVRVLRPEIELVLLLLHLNKDRFAFLGPFLDIRQILERAPLDWDYLHGFVAAEALEVPVWKSFAAVADVLGIEHEAPRVTGLRAWSWDRFWSRHARLGGDEARARAPSVSRLLALHASGRIGDKAREVRRQLLPHRPLLELAGRLEPGRSYAGHVARTYVEHLTPGRARRSRAVPEGASL
ncbi:MAG TPA: nucleotidyltransferase family protein [Acidimicrobiales bacterium]|nr:nucleotidyltransferase family protein [Acidimicrobiales bacterium]